MEHLDELICRFKVIFYEENYIPNKTMHFFYHTEKFPKFV